MRVTKYDTRLDSDKLPMLVKESGFNYGKAKEAMTSPTDIYWFMRDHEDLEGLDRECLWMLCFDTKQKLIGYFTVTQGVMDCSLIRPREVFIKALAVGAMSIILVHNHPSGDATPSRLDIEATKQVKEAGEIIGITLADHLVLGDKTYCSMYEHHLF